MKTLDKYRKNIYSQNGEDGILSEILRRLEIKKGSCVEFGAWDGKFLSNTYHLVTQGWNAVYIEGDATRFGDLKRTCAEHPEGQIIPIQSMVGTEGPCSLDELLAQTPLAKDFELLSIDVDSIDWQIWASLKNYRPRIVVIEINSSVLPGIKQVHQDNHILGSSFSSTLELGNRKGYRLACHTGNMIFVDEPYFTRLGLTELEILAPEMLFDYSWARPRTISKTTWLSKFRDRIGINANGNN